MVSKDSSLTKPNPSALDVSSLVGHPSTIVCVFSSTFDSTNSLAFVPPTVFNASNMWVMEMVRPGKLSVLDLALKSLVGILLAMIKFLTTVLGEQTHRLRSFETGRIAFSPFKGSLKIPEAKDDAAPVGFPGLTVTYF